MCKYDLFPIMPCMSDAVLFLLPCAINDKYRNFYNNKT